MAVIDFGPIEFDDSTQFFEECRTSGFDTEDLQDFDERIGIRPDRIDIFDSQHFRKIDSVRFQLPLVSDAITSVLFLISPASLHHEDSCNAGNTAKTDRIEHVALEIP